MTQFLNQIEACPRCGSSDHVKRKLVLIALGDPARLNANWRVSCNCEGTLSVSDLQPEYRAAGSTGQFIQGLYCEYCGIGYVPEHMAKPTAPAYRAAPEGWQRVYSDGTLGPLLKRIADDPDGSLSLP